LPSVVKSMREIRPDAVLLFYTSWVYEKHLMITLVPILSKILLPKVPFVTQLETEEAWYDASLLTRGVIKILRYFKGPYVQWSTLLYGSDRLITLSEKLKNALLENFPNLNSRILVIPPPPLVHMCEGDHENDRSMLRRSVGINETEFLIVYFGYIYSAKGVDILFEAMRILKARAEMVRPVIVGGGVDLQCPSPDVQGLLDLARTLDIQDRITWTGNYDSESDDASKWLYAADACVLPFNSGVTLNRSSFAAAAAHGLPIITTRGKTLESPFLDRQNVYLCPPQDSEAIARAVESLMNSPALGELLRSGALDLASEYFSWNKAVDQTVDALTGNPRDRGPVRLAST